MSKTRIIIKSILTMITRQYLEIWSFLKAHRPLLGMVFLCCMELFVFYGMNGQPDNHYAIYVENTLPQYSNTFFFIVFENLKVATMMMFAGIIPAFLGCLCSAMMTIRSFMATFKFLLPSFHLHTMILSLLPHGIFEMSVLLFSIMLSCIMSKEITLFIIKLTIKKDIVIFEKECSSIGIKQTALMIMQCWLLIIFPLTFLAAIIEVSLSPMILKMLL